MKLGVAIDPGKRHAGVTMFDLATHEILRAGLVKVASEGEGPTPVVQLARAILAWTGYASVHTLVVEWPQTYGGRASEGDANDLLPLVGLDCALAMHAYQAVHYRPHDWGATGKPKSTKQPYPVEGRVREKLTPRELARVDWTKNVQRSWDVTDSLAMALKYMGRYERVRALPRE